MGLARYQDGKALDVWVTGNDGRVYTAFYNDDGPPWTGWHPVEEPSKARCEGAVDWPTCSVDACHGA